MKRLVDSMNKKIDTFIYYSSNTLKVNVYDKKNYISQTLTPGHNRKLLAEDMYSTVMTSSDIL